MSHSPLLDHARQWVQAGLIAAMPMSAMAVVEVDETPAAPSTAELEAGYSATATYSNSGWFTGEIDTTKTSVSTLGLGFKLSGDNRFEDAQRYTKSYYSCDDSGCDAGSVVYSRGDTTGIAMVWGGRVTGEFGQDDRLMAGYEFLLDWTHTPVADGLYDYASVSWNLVIGVNEGSWDGSPYVPEQYQSLPGNMGGYTGSASGYLDTPGSSWISGEIEAWLPTPDYTPEGGWHWFAQLTVDFDEAGVRWTWPGDPAPASINGDYLRVMVPNQSIDVGINAIPTAVPEAGSVAMALAGLGVAGAMVWRRRRQGH